MRTRGSRKAHEEKQKKSFMFLIVFNHVNACASMRSLVEIHNNPFYSAQKQNLS